MQNAEKANAHLHAGAVASLPLSGVQAAIPKLKHQAQTPRELHDLRPSHASHVPSTIRAAQVRASADLDVAFTGEGCIGALRCGEA